MTSGQPGSKGFGCHAKGGAAAFSIYEYPPRFLVFRDTRSNPDTTRTSSFAERTFPPLATACNVANGVVAVGISSRHEGQFPKPKLSDVKIMFFELVAGDARNR